MIFIKKLIIAAVLIFPNTAIYAQQLTLGDAIKLAEEQLGHVWNILWNFVLERNMGASVFCLQLLPYLPGFGI